MLLVAKGLVKTFKKGNVRAVSDASFSLAAGKTLGIVGASGCGKSTLLKMILRLVSQDAGEIYFNGERIDPLKENQLKLFRKKTQIVFQDPILSLDPRMKISVSLREPFILMKEPKGVADQRIGELLHSVGLPERFLGRYPHELSGGECQRVAIARALSLKPQLLLCDEVVSSLDAVTKIRILNLFLELQKKEGLSLLFVSHDQRVVQHMSHEILVMKEGVLV